jgi:death-on-curing protein
MINFLNLEEIVHINNIVIKISGGSVGIRDKNLLESAVSSSKSLYFYNNADLYKIATAYAFSIIKNHPFLDGNKRTGFACMRIFLSTNDLHLNFKQQETEDIMVNIANNEVDFLGLENWLRGLKEIGYS